MQKQSQSIVPAPSGTYLVMAQERGLVSYDPIIAYRLSCAGGPEGTGSRIAMLASGDEQELAETFEGDQLFGVMDASGRVYSRMHLYSDAEAFCQAVFGA